MNRIPFSKRHLLGLLGVLFASLSLIGCDEAYSNLVQYALRTDPLAKTDKFGDERLDPDPPGILPILSAKDLLDPRNPMYPKRDTLFVEGHLRDPQGMNTADRDEVKKWLDSWFGTPRNPKAKDAPASLGLDDKELAKGSSLYRVHCLHCHGVSGDGRGVTARWVNPHPRDFRQGLFKFQAVDQTSAPSPPRREDLRRTLVQGVEGTAMPAFNLMHKDDIEALVSYVMHLSVRGRLEYDTIMNAFEYDAKEKTLKLPEDSDSLEDTMRELLKGSKNGLYVKWERANNKAIKVKPYPFKEGVENEEFYASVRRGHSYFTGTPTADTPKAKNANCVSCHKDFGRQSNFKWDAWGTLVRPNNLTQGQYRGGRRTVDLYYRIHSGINGSGMTPFSILEDGDDRAIWDLVNFVQVMPFPKMLEKAGVKLQ